MFADFDSVFLPPGFLGNLKLKYERRIRMPHPHGTCINHMDTKVTDAHAYAGDHCYASCIQAHVADTCSCMDINPYTDGNKTYTNFTKCFDIERSPEDLLQTWECVFRERNHAILQCAICKEVCDDLKYDTQVGCLLSCPYTHTQIWKFRYWYSTCLPQFQRQPFSRQRRTRNKCYQLYNHDLSQLIVIIKVSTKWLHDEFLLGKITSRRLSGLFEMHGPTLCLLTSSLVMMYTAG